MFFTFNVRKTALLWVMDWEEIITKESFDKIRNIYKGFEKEWFARGRRNKCFLLEMFEFYWELLWSFTHVWFIYKIFQIYMKVFWWLKPFSRYNILLHTVPNTLKAGTYKYMLHLIYVGILTSVFSFCSISQMCHMSK